jgi:AcrR family transcriptional regulator
LSNSAYLSPKQRRLRNREEMTAAIVQTARDIMREQGVATLNLNEIARRLGMKTPSLYEYFPNKMALYDHLFRLGTRLFVERIAQAEAEPGLSPWEQIERVLAAYLHCAVENPDLFKLVYERHVPGFAPSDESMEEANASLEAANQSLQSFLKAAQLDPAANIEQMRDFYIALMHGITALHLANNPDQPVGSGRFGSLIPLAIEMLKKAWGKDTE